MGPYLANQNLNIDHVYCSDATRTQQTLTLLSEYLTLSSSHISLAPQLYLASVTELIEVIGSIPNAYQTVMLLGHNPGLTELCNELANDNLTNLPTCSIYMIQLFVDDWQAVTRNTGERVLFMTPRMLKDAG